MVEVVGADLQELLAARALCQPLRETGVVLRPRELARPEYATSRMRKCLKRYAGSPEIDGAARAAGLAEQQVVEQRIDVVEVGDR